VPLTAAGAVGACVAGAVVSVAAGACVAVLPPDVALVATGFALFVPAAAGFFVATVDDDEAEATAAVPELSPTPEAPAKLIALVAPN
jgi:hypothetical protein